MTPECPRSQHDENCATLQHTGYTFGHKAPHPVLAKYGLETMAGDPLEILDRHLSNNRAATEGGWELALDKMYERYEELWDAGNVAYGALMGVMDEKHSMMREIALALEEAKNLIIRHDLDKLEENSERRLDR